MLYIYTVVAPSKHFPSCIRDSTMKWSLTKSLMSWQPKNSLKFQQKKVHPGGHNQGNQGPITHKQKQWNIHVIPCHTMSYPTYRWNKPHDLRVLLGVKHLRLLRFTFSLSRSGFPQCKACNSPISGCNFEQVTSNNIETNNIPAFIYVILCH
jgi:hypothetical protein